MKFSRKILLFLVFVLLFTNISTITFASLEEHEKKLVYLFQTGILQGDANDPMLYDYLTREQMIVVISRLKGEEFIAENFPTESMTFLDVPLNSWAASYIAWAQANGVTEGYNEYCFGYNDKLTYWQAKAFLIRTLGYSPSDYEDVISAADDLGIFIDSIGLNHLEDGQYITRDDAAGLIYNALYAPNSKDKRIIDILVLENINEDISDVKQQLEQNMNVIETAIYEELSYEGVNDGGSLIEASIMMRMNAGSLNIINPVTNETGCPEEGNYANGGAATYSIISDRYYNVSNQESLGIWPDQSSRLKGMIAIVGYTNKESNRNEVMLIPYDENGNKLKDMIRIITR